MPSVVSTKAMVRIAARPWDRVEPSEARPFLFLWIIRNRSIQGRTEFKCSVFEILSTSCSTNWFFGFARSRLCSSVVFYAKGVVSIAWGWREAATPGNRWQNIIELWRSSVAVRHAATHSALEVLSWQHNPG